MGDEPQEDSGDGRPAGAEAAAHREFPCGQCGAKIVFEPSVSKLKCPYCGAETDIPQAPGNVEELDFHGSLRQLDEKADKSETAVVACSSCGARVAMAERHTAGACPFCGSPVVSAAGAFRGIKPGALLPFKIARDDGEGRFRVWIKGLWFAPNKLRQYARQEGRLAGVYVPYWTFDSRTTSWYTGERGDDYWETEHYTATVNGRSERRTRQVRRTRWRSVSGVVREFFDDVLVLASSSLPAGHARKLEPWDLKNAVPFQPDYLSGFRAETYQVGLADGFERAAKIMDEGIRASVRRDIGGDHQRIHSLNTKHENITFKHILLPVWICAYRFGERVFRVMINARTGEVQGERPWSWVKITLAVLAALAVAGGAAALIAALSGS